MKQKSMSRNKHIPLNKKKQQHNTNGAVLDNTCTTYELLGKVYIYIWLNALFTRKRKNVNMEVHPEGELNRLAVLRFPCAFQTPFAVWIPGTAVVNNTSIVFCIG